MFSSRIAYDMAAFAMGSNMLMPDKATSIGKAQPLATAGMERLPVITAAAANPMPITFAIVANRLIF